MIGVYADGTVNKQEREFLDRKMQELNLTSAAAREIEEEVKRDVQEVREDKPQ